ncbi:MAG: MBL fold metallo-hydrolase, partial [Planctomycetes bacterium]|nr:MBL fold metallo-hydrolase [Planctomycetota bacterium]
MHKSNFERLLPDLYRVADTCNVYLLRDGDRAVAIDFGSGQWTTKLAAIGVKQLDYVLLTHHHRDQCEGLLKLSGPTEVRNVADIVECSLQAAPSARSQQANPPQADCTPMGMSVRLTEVRAPAAEAGFLTVEGVERYWKARTARPSGYPTSFSVLPKGLPSVKCVMGEGGDLFWGRHRIRFLPTPGHSAGALTIMVTWQGRNVFFCGDAVHAGGKIWQPFHLEWDHWTPSGALAAWFGLQRLGYCKIDLLGPSHGPVVVKNANACVKLAQKRVMALIRAKGSVCEGERDDYFPFEPLDGVAARRVLPHLYQFGANSFLLVSNLGEGLVVDPYKPDLGILDALMPLTAVRRISVATVSHFHYDHSDGFPLAKEKYGAASWMHPWIADV